ncbi:S-adenosyl-L-methionine-dependent methyltransferase, partial [Vararia minispora EC-137]
SRPPMDTAKSRSSVRDPANNFPVFGARFLTAEDDVWAHNAWDHVAPPDDQDDAVAAALARQRAAPVAAPDRALYNDSPARHWDSFYRANQANFFKDRKWLHLEFPELLAAAAASAGPKTVVEFGCGVGNSLFPLLSANANPALTIRAYDYSAHAVACLQRNPLYAAPACGSVSAAVHDLTAPALPDSLAPASADFVLLVFVLSALHPAEWPAALRAAHSALKPGGTVLIRDYGRHDLTQLRFRSNRLLEDNLYVRGDKTRVYFFELDELALLFTGQRAKGADVDVRESTEVQDAPARDPPPLADRPHSASTPTIHPSLLSPDPLHPDLPPHPLFAAQQLGIDRRLLVNRKRQLKMYRVWMQAKFIKL